MRLSVRLAFAALLMGGPIAAMPAYSAPVGWTHQFQNGDYDYRRHCKFYRQIRLPAPGRCYYHYRRIYGIGVLRVGDFVFRDRADYDYWRNRDDYRHWQKHEYDHTQWH